MPSFKSPSFRERAGQAADAKKDALAQLRLKPPADDATIALRRQSAERRQVVRAGQASTRRAKASAAAQSKAAAKAEAAVPAPTDSERKAQRDARYAARKSRR
jgi:hypothetical protein